MTKTKKIYEVPTWKPQRIQNKRCFVLLDIYGKKLGSVIQTKWVNYCECCDQPLYVLYPKDGYRTQPEFHAYNGGMKLGTIYHEIQSAQKAVEEFLQISCKNVKNLEPKLIK